MWNNTTFIPSFVKVHPFVPDLIGRGRTPRLAYDCGVCSSMHCIGLATGKNKGVQ